MFNQIKTKQEARQMIFDLELAILRIDESKMIKNKEYIKSKLQPFLIETKQIENKLYE